MSAKFEKAVATVSSLREDGPVKPSQNDQLKFYSLYKQATVGNVTTSRPGMLDWTGRAKWDAWKKVEGKSQDDAKQEYYDALDALLASNDSEEAKTARAELNAVA